MRKNDKGLTPPRVKKGKTQNSRKIVKHFLMLFIAILMFLPFLNMKTTYAYSSENRGSNAVDKTSYFYFEIRGGPKGNSKVRLRLDRTGGASTFNSMLTQSSTWKVQIYSGTNNHDIRLGATSVTTQKDINGEYLVVNIPISYEMPAYYKYKDMFRDAPNLGHRFNFEYYHATDTRPNSAAETGKAQSSNSRRSINLQLNTSMIGLRTANKVMYWNTTLGFNIWRQQYTISYHSNGGTGSMAGQTIDYGFSQKLRLNTFTKTGHHYINWKAYRTYDNTWCWNNGSGGQVWKKEKPTDAQAYQYKNGGSVATSVPSGDLQLHAMWGTNKAQIAYNPNGGKVSAAGYGYNDYGWITQNGNTYFHTVNYGENTDPYNASTFGLTRPGYTFSGWKVSCGGKILDQDTQYGSGTYLDQADGQTTANKSLVTCYLYAQWTPINCKVTFVDGLGTTLKTQSVPYGSDATPPPNPTRTGYTFAGWNGNYKNVTSDRTITATWRINTYTLYFNANGGTVSPESRPVTYGSQYGTLPTPTRTGYTFNGWYTESSGGSRVSSTTTMGASNTTIYAQWTPIYYNVTFVDGLGTTLKTQSVPYGSDATPPPNPIRTGYTFAGWNGSYTNVTSNRTITATWRINTYTNSIAHWAGGFTQGEGNNNSKDKYNFANTTFSAQYGSTYTMDSSRKATLPKGFYLSGSFGSRSISDSWDSYGMGTKVTQKANEMIYEYYYYPNTYKINYNLDGGSNNSANPSTYNILYGITLQNPTREGYEFVGWYNGNTKVTGINQGANASFSSQSDFYDKLNSRTIGDITLTAKWLPIKPPELKVKDQWFYTGNVVTIDMLLDSVKVTDKYNDDIIYDDDIQNKVKIEKIVDVGGNSYNVNQNLITDIPTMYEVTFSVTNKYNLTSKATSRVEIIEQHVKSNTYSMRFISQKYLNTLSMQSKWGQGSLKSKLMNTLQKEAKDSNAIYVIELTDEKCEEIKSLVSENTSSSNNSLSVNEKIKNLILN